MVNFDASGFHLFSQVFSPDVLAPLSDFFESGKAGVRNGLWKYPALSELAHSSALRNILHQLDARPFRPVRILLFNKSMETNWAVDWHQDLAVALKRQLPVDGFGPWSVKKGQCHAHAPAPLLEGMVTLRIHLDPCRAENGALKVLPGSHRLGKLDASRLGALSREENVICTADPGDVLAMRPLLVHASTSCVAAGPRRVIHIEFSPDSLPGGLEWAGSDGEDSKG